MHLIGSLSNETNKRMQGSEPNLMQCKYALYVQTGVEKMSNWKQPFPLLMKEPGGTEHILYGPIY